MSKNKKLNFMSLAVPIFIEMLLWTTFNNVDTIMLSRYSDVAVAAVGSTGQLVFFIMLFLQIIATGTGILISQNLGKRDYEKAENSAKIALYFNFLVGILLSILVFKYHFQMVKFLGLEDKALLMGSRFYKIIGTFTFIQAIGLINTTILRSYRFPKYSMYINIFSNILNIIGNAIFIFGLFGMPVLGEVGVAISTVFSQFIGIIISFIIIKKKLNIHLLSNIKIKENLYLLKEIGKIGIPSVAENLLYNTSQIMIIKMVATYGTDALTARAYIFTLLRFVFIISISSGSAAQIITGFLAGANRHRVAKKAVIKIYLQTVLLIIIVATTLIIFRENLIRIFTTNEAVILLAKDAFLTILFLETGRTLNIIFISSMKGAGDVIFPVIMGVIFMWIVGVGGGYLLVIKFGFGLFGAFIATGLDEWSRGIIMFIRWIRGDWIKIIKK
ncbi:putative MATE family efflux protein [Hypnocyclicus thermotrophus]|uniref:MATE family efflux protein n=1 Tax=Hypnocyclicus thermotrophus TaxID=1627895 RepID=A0AA46DZY7_9FUSO|nr:MATE family efflux transporter [Hypnocyclicus thermotrophus]TDT71973.1 putative MATE family efflux protein [Hypnocyclicus thermotrophus]